MYVSIGSLYGLHTYLLEFQIKKGGAVLGRNLARIQQKTKKVIRADKQEGYLHTTDLQDGYDWGRLNLASVTEEDSYQDFLNTAELAGRDFDAEKWNVKLLDAQTRHVYIRDVKDCRAFQ